jgi:hypothetical protein
VKEGLSIRYVNEDYYGEQYLLNNFILLHKARPYA